MLGAWKIFNSAMAKKRMGGTDFFSRKIIKITLKIDFVASKALPYLANIFLTNHTRK